MSFMVCPHSKLECHPVAHRRRFSPVRSLCSASGQAYLPLQRILERRSPIATAIRLTNAHVAKHRQLAISRDNSVAALRARLGNEPDARIALTGESVAKAQQLGDGNAEGRIAQSNIAAHADD